MQHWVHVGLECMLNSSDMRNASWTPILATWTNQDILKHISALAAPASNQIICISCLLIDTSRLGANIQVDLGLERWRVPPSVGRQVYSCIYLTHSPQSGSLCSLHILHISPQHILSPCFCVSVVISLSNRALECAFHHNLEIVQVCLAFHKDISNNTKM